MRVTRQRKNLKRGIFFAVAAWTMIGLSSGEETARTMSPTLGQLLEMQPLELSEIDLLQECLLCASDLPGTRIDMESCREEFNSWVTEIRRHSPEGDERQKAQALVEVVRRGLRARDIPVSFQIAYVAMGRRLGYPLKLGAKNGDSCVFWVDGKTKFEVSGLRRSELLWSNAEVEHPSQNLGFRLPAKDGAPEKEWILSPKDELSIFMGIRALKLEGAGFNDEALVSFSQAHQLSPDCLDHLYGILRVAKKITPLVGHTAPMQIPIKGENPLEELERMNQMRSLDAEISQLRAEKERLLLEKARKGNR